jgi:hypothetical protein
MACSSLRGCELVEGRRRRRKVKKRKRKANGRRKKNKERGRIYLVVFAHKLSLCSKAISVALFLTLRTSYQLSPSLNFVSYDGEK